jgi:hypothetical protein
VPDKVFVVGRSLSLAADCRVSSVGVSCRSLLLVSVAGCLVLGICCWFSVLPSHSLLLVADCRLLWAPVVMLVSAVVDRHMIRTRLQQSMVS